MLLECKECKKKKEDTEFYAGTECYECWEKGINENRVKELKEKLNQYLEIDKGEVKKDLALKELEEARQIIKNNYVPKSDTQGGVASNKGGKELIKALWETGKKAGRQPSSYLLILEQRIKALKPSPVSPPEPKEIEYNRNCPICDKEFFCELEKSNTSEKEASERLGEQLRKHIEEAHKEKNTLDPSSDLGSSNKINKPSENGGTEKIKAGAEEKKEFPWKIVLPVGAIAIFLLGIIAFFLHTKSKSIKNNK